MADYIKREDALSVAHKIGKEEYDSGCVSNAATVMIVEGYLRAIPAADVVERKHGKWITEDGKPLPYGVCFSVCSECGHSSPASGFSFCPNCGADMRKLPKESE